jgi:hypothetical protein
LFHKHSVVLGIAYHESGVDGFKVAFVARIWETILRGRFGDLVESKLKSMQVRRIESSPMTKKYPELIVYNDKEMRFHPPKLAESKK